MEIALEADALFHHFRVPTGVRFADAGELSPKSCAIGFANFLGQRVKCLI